MLLLYCHWVLLMVAKCPWGGILPLLKMLNSILATFWEAEAGLTSWLMRQHRDSWNHSSSAKPCPAGPEFCASKPLKMWLRNLRFLHLQWNSLECWPKSETPDLWAVKHPFFNQIYFGFDADWRLCATFSVCEHEQTISLMVQSRSWSCRWFSSWKGSWKPSLPPAALVTGRPWCHSCPDGSLAPDRTHSDGQPEK